MASWREWLRRDEAGDPRHVDKHADHPWYLVIWLTGVDYFSTLGYQPGIALLAAGPGAPISHEIPRLVGPFWPAPVFGQEARRSLAGRGSLTQARELPPGWRG